MFSVEMRDQEVDLFQVAFGYRPALLHDPWEGYTGVAVYRSNQWRTYSVDGERSDARYGDLWFLTSEQERRSRLQEMAKAKDPEAMERIVERDRRQFEFDSETLRGYTELMAASAGMERNAQGRYVTKRPWWKFWA